MRRRPTRMVDGRAIIGVIALYALLLQAFLAVCAPVPALALEPGVLCADHGGAPADGAAKVVCHPCCTVVHGTALGAPPATASAVSWPRPAFARVAWRPEAEVPKTGPPVRAASARGPPAA